LKKFYDVSNLKGLLRYMGIRERMCFMKKKILVFFLAALTLLSITGTALANTYSNRLTGSLQFEGRTARCSGLLFEDGAELTMKMTLKRGTQVLASWTASGNSYVGIGEEFVVTSGATYTLLFETWVNGEKQPDVTTTNKPPF